MNGVAHLAKRPRLGDFEMHRTGSVRHGVVIAPHSAGFVTAVGLCAQLSPCRTVSSGGCWPTRKGWAR